MSSKRFAVIGAGAGGLCAAKYLLASGIEPVIFEIGSRIGGLWVYENDSGRSPAYKSLRINSESKVSSYLDFPFPEGTQFYPGTTEMEAYFEAYARTFDLSHRVRFKSRIEKIEPEGEGYLLTIAGGETEHFDGVVVASGHQSTPRHPEQVKGFSGDYIHAHAFRVPDPYAGKRVLVIGPGNSGVDIAADICTVTEQTYLAARSPVLIMPRLMFGKPQSRTLMLLEQPWLPWRLKVWIRTQLTRVFHGRMEDWGFRTPKGRTHPISHPTLIFHLAWNRIKGKPGIDRVDGQTVHFTDGSAEEIDAIIAATGYETDLPFLPQEASPVRGTHMHLYNRIVHPDLPNMFFVGYFDATGGSNIRMMDEQSEYVAAVASGKIKLPDQERLKQAIQEDLDFQKTQFPDSPRYGLELDPVRYRKRLAAEYKRNGVPRKKPRPVKPVPLKAEAPA